MRSTNIFLPSTCLLLVMLCGSHALAEEEAEEAAALATEANEEEGRFGNFLPLPIFITEPAIGEGIGAGLVYFHKSPAERPKILTGDTIVRTARRSKPPPTASGVFAAYTNNDTSGVGIGHARSMKDDRYRFVGMFADMKVIAATFASDIPFNFELEGDLAFASIKRRFGDSNVFLGLSVSTLDADIGFKLGSGDTPPISIFDFTFRTVGTALSSVYDARDDSMMPSSGQLVDLTTWWYDDAIGSDFDYTTARLKAHSFHQLHEKFVLGLRLDVSTVGGNAPFFAVPYVSIRGIPALRYQGDTAGAIEVEGRYQLSDRWAAIAFAGKGFTDTDRPVQDTEDNIRAGGVGIRFKAIKEQNIWVGLDIAWGPEEDAWYIQVGHPW